MTTTRSNSTQEYGIGAVAKLTGLTDHTIRAWERRYKAVVAHRSSSDRRVYDREQVEKLGLLRSLTEQGVSIGQIAHENIDELRTRLRTLNVLVSTPVPDRINAAVVGEFLPGQLLSQQNELGPVNLEVMDDNRERFLADLGRNDIDVVLVESPVLDTDVIEDMHTLLKRAGAAGGVLIYSFGRAPDVNDARDTKIVVLRAPVSVSEVREATIRAMASNPAPRTQKSTVPELNETEWEYTGPVAPRRFNSKQLATLVQASTSIDCECPHHLAQLVGDLNAFEVYSANCENRDADDAELHRYLHKTTAQARALIEVALERVARTEGINY